MSYEVQPTRKQLLRVEKDERKKGTLSREKYGCLLEAIRSDGECELRLCRPVPNSTDLFQQPSMASALLCILRV